MLLRNWWIRSHLEIMNDFETANRKKMSERSKYWRLKLTSHFFGRSHKKPHSFEEGVRRSVGQIYSADSRTPKTQKIQILKLTSKFQQQWRNRVDSFAKVLEGKKMSVYLIVWSAPRPWTVAEKEEMRVHQHISNCFQKILRKIYSCQKIMIGTIRWRNEGAEKSVLYSG